MKLAALLLGLILFGSVANAEAVERSVLRGVVANPDATEEPVRLETEQGKTVELVAETDNRLTLRDPELAGRTWEIEGRYLDSGEFEIAKMYTIKDGERHKVTYYCNICHITSYRPGRCMCCQKDVELQETPADE